MCLEIAQSAGNPSKLAPFYLSRLNPKSQEKELKKYSRSNGIKPPRILRVEDLIWPNSALSSSWQRFYWLVSAKWLFVSNTISFCQVCFNIDRFLLWKLGQITTRKIVLFIIACKIIIFINCTQLQYLPPARIHNCFLLHNKCTQATAALVSVAAWPLLVPKKCQILSRTQLHDGIKLTPKWGTASATEQKSFI